MTAKIKTAREKRGGESTDEGDDDQCYTTYNARNQKQQSLVGVEFAEGESGQTIRGKKKMR
jgi:hypothetical protein